MSNPGLYNRRAAVQSVPTGDVLGTYDTYLEAQAIVDRLAKADFPVAKVSIVGNDLKTVERVTRKRSWHRAAMEGALSGAWLGLLIALLLSLFSPTFSWAYFGAALVIGAAFGVLFRIASYALSRRNRDFDSTTQVLAANYQVLVEAGTLPRAQELLAQHPAP